MSDAEPDEDANLVVIHLGHMPIEEEERYTRAELKRRFEVAGRLRREFGLPALE